MRNDRVRWPRVLVALAATLVCAPASASPERDAPLPPTRIAELAAALGYDAGRLALLDSGTTMLLDGRRLERFKALDAVTGEIVGGAFDRGVPVDLRAAERAAGHLWRARNGALTPALVARLVEAGPADLLPVVAWLEVDLSSVPERPAHEPSVVESGSALGVPAGPDDAAVAVVARPAFEAEKPASAARPFLTETERAARAERRAALAAADARHREAVRAALAPAREAFLAAAAAAGVEVSYASEIVPMAVLSGTREQIERLAFAPGIDALYDGSGRGGPSLQYARPTQNVTPINDVGYTGEGVSVSVTEGERGYAANPYLVWTGFYDGAQPYANHPTAVGGMIRSTHPLQQGLAVGVNLYSANGSYTNFATMAAAMDWGSMQASVLSNSWFWDSPNSPDPSEADRHQDYFARYHYDTVLVAAGNFGNGCSGGFSSYVVSPAKGLNVLAIGNFDDVDSVSWTGDGMETCSSFGDPHDSSGHTISKPELSGVGTSLTSTLPSNDPGAAVGPVGSGTSYSTPMVAATAADMMEADPDLTDTPEVLKALLMATALHNIEGASRYSDVDGAGGLVGAAAVVSVERGNWTDESIGSATTFPITKFVYAYAGEPVRFAIAWQANPNATYTTDPLPADLDLAAYRADGTTLVASSASTYNSFEMVEFIAPASENYQFRISLYSSDWSSGNTWLASGWWRGEYRISPDIGYSDPVPSPTGTHLVVHPADWPVTNYWRVFGERPKGSSDHDLELANRSLFEDPGARSVLAASNFAGGAPDFAAVDGNHWSSASAEHYRVLRWSGAEGYDISLSNLGLGASSSDTVVTLGPVTFYSSEVVKAVDVWVPARSHRRVRVVPTGGSGDLGLRFFQSDASNPTTWARSRFQALVARNRSSSGTAIEQGGVFNATSSGDWLGLVIEKLDTGSVTFEVQVLPASLFSDDFESGDAAEWSSVAP